MEWSDARYFEKSLRESPTIIVSRRDPATSEQIARRRELFAEAARLRELIGPSGLSTAELIRQVREE